MSTNESNIEALASLALGTRTNGLRAWQEQSERYATTRRERAENPTSDRGVTSWFNSNATRTNPVQLPASTPRITPLHETATHAALMSPHHRYNVLARAALAHEINADNYFLWN